MNDKFCLKCMKFNCDGSCFEWIPISGSDNTITINLDWISVKDRIPQQYDHVLISDGKIVTTSYFQDGSFVGNEIDIQTTHWMPLPDPPLDDKM